MAEKPDVVHIQSLRSNDLADPAPIQIEWRGWQGFASVEAVRQTAEDLFTCAAWADALGALLKLGMDGGTSAQFVSHAMTGRGRPYFGHRDTLDLLPGASSFRKAGGSSSSAAVIGVRSILPRRARWAASGSKWPRRRNRIRSWTRR